MVYDERHRNLSSVAVGMADIQLSHNPLASEVVVIFNDLSVDHYQDSRIAEEGRVKKLAVFRKTENMEFVPDSDGGELQIDDDSVPYEVLLTRTGLPRIPRRDDMVLCDGELYSVHHVKPMNRNIDGLWQLIVYPERTEFVDPTCIHKYRFLDGTTLLPFTDDVSGHVGEEVVLDMVYGGRPELLSWDAKHWFPFKSRIRFVYDGQKIIHVKGGVEQSYKMLEK